MKKFLNHISYKNNVLVFSSLLLTTSIVCPLTSCGSDGTSNDIGGFDKEFGFDVQTYNNLERQFTSKYSAYLFGQGLEKEEYKNKLNKFLQNDLTILRNKLFDPAQNYSFTIRTNTLLDYASKNYNIQLNRNANVSEIDFDNLRLSSLENFVIYMENMRFAEDEITKRKTKFNEKFDTILDDCKKKTDDNAQVLMYLRVNIIDCWQDLNDEFAHMSAYNHLKNFFNEYEFVVKAPKDNGDLWWDDLLNDPIFMGNKENIGKIDQDINCQIGDHWINTLFTISKISERKEDEDTPAGSNQNNVTSSDKLNKYHNGIIPGYILTPVLKTMSQDIYSNNYYMNIDWQLYCDSYQDKDQKTKNKVTAHLATTKDEKMINNDNSSDDVNKFSSNDYQFTRYNLMATSQYQRKNLFEAYFDQTKEPDQKIVFSWDKDKIGIEYFLPSDSIRENGEYNLPLNEYKVSMAQGNLSSIGLQLNGTNLSDLLSKKTDLQNSQSAINTNNDDNLKIEEKFVKYCGIDANANVSFFNNKISHNAIENNFTVTFANTNIEYKVETKSNMNNIGPSKIFSNNAVNFYKKVVDYVNAGKILKEVEDWYWLSYVIKIEFIIALALMFVFFIYEYIKVCLLQVNGRPVYPNNKSIVHTEIFCYITYTIVLIILYTLWDFAVSDPISNEVDKVKKWNNMITDTSKSPNNKINVINKVNGVDKDYFESTNNFMEYYKINSNSAFASYFYYFHFVEFSQKQTNNEQLTTFDKKVMQDYDNFNKTKKECEISDRTNLRIVIGVILSLLVVLLVFVFIYNLYLTKLLVEDRNKLKRRNNQIVIQNHNQLNQQNDQIAIHLHNAHNNMNELQNNMNNSILVNNNVDVEHINNRSGYLEGEIPLV